MALILSCLGLMALLALAVYYPPAALAVYALTCDASDAMGVSSFLRVSGFDLFVQGAKGPLLVAVLVSCARAWQYRGRRYGGQRVWLLVAVLAVCQMWVVFGAAVKGEAIGSLGSFAIYTGLPAAVVTLVYCREKKAKAIFVSAVLAQLALSAFLLAFPSGPAAVLNATNYPMYDTELLGRVEAYDGGIARAGAQQRIFAQFHNPQAYGLYALVGIAIGTYLLLSSTRKRERWAGAAMVVLGCFGWSVTVPRGATVGLLVAAAVILARGAAARGISRSTKLLLIGIATAGAAAFVFLPSQASELMDVFAVSADDQGVLIRSEVAGRALSQIGEFPIFGVTSAVFNAERIGVHQVMGYFAVMFGIPAGLACTWLLVVAAWASVARTRNRAGTSHATAGVAHSRAERDLATALIGIVIGMGLTNNFGASMLFWGAWAVACLPRQVSTIQRRGAVRTPRLWHDLAATVTGPPLRPQQVPAGSTATLVDARAGAARTGPVGNGRPAIA